MSEPWPPAFIRTAPPTEPGTPTAHSKPVRPGLDGLAGDDRQQGGAAGGDLGAGDVDAGEGVAEADGEPGEAGIGDEQVRAVADDEDVDAAGSATAAPTAARTSSSATSTNRAAGPPTL